MSDLKPAGATDGVFHMVSDHEACPKCGAKEYEVRNHSLIWHDGDVHCAKCGTFIRSYDAG